MTQTIQVCSAILVPREPLWWGDGVRGVRRRRDDAVIIGGFSGLRGLVLVLVFTRFGGTHQCS
ncbi:hypothetical protein A5635_03030 [Mycobacterium asiaticum]|uniref:Uncharacterized protein n=1 Tax=Mycobacterium asiaticum TaxID=1790 RepID=A0A1A3N8F7_MYCAS|nr:hypothetical protein A5635_03030 [Mycobacterium asiaticum]